MQFWCKVHPYALSFCEVNFGMGNKIHYDYNVKKYFLLEWRLVWFQQTFLQKLAVRKHFYSWTPAVCETGWNAAYAARFTYPYLTRYKCAGILATCWTSGGGRYLRCLQNREATQAFAAIPRRYCSAFTGCKRVVDSKNCKIIGVYSSFRNKCMKCYRWNVI